MRPKRPYLIRALYDWIVDNDLTPYLLVQVDGPDVVVPQDFVEDGRIVLNVSPAAVRSLALENDVVSFSGRFSGQAFNVVVPMRAIAAIYAKESGEGMMFEPEYASGAQTEQPSESKSEEAAGATGNQRSTENKERPAHLKVIK